MSEKWVTDGDDQVFAYHICRLHIIFFLYQSSDSQFVRSLAEAFHYFMMYGVGDLPIRE
jgi:hypothetical protein